MHLYVHSVDHFETTSFYKIRSNWLSASTSKKNRHFNFFKISIKVFFYQKQKWNILKHQQLQQLKSDNIPSMMRWVRTVINTIPLLLDPLLWIQVDHQPLVFTESALRKTRRKKIKLHNIQMITSAMWNQPSGPWLECVTAWQICHGTISGCSSTYVLVNEYMEHLHTD